MAYPAPGPAHESVAVAPSTAQSSAGTDLDASHGGDGRGVVKTPKGKVYRKHLRLHPQRSYAKADVAPQQDDSFDLGCWEHCIVCDSCRPVCLSMSMFCMDWRIVAVVIILALAPSLASVTVGFLQVREANALAADLTRDLAQAAGSEVAVQLDLALDSVSKDRALRALQQLSGLPVDSFNTSAVNNPSSGLPQGFQDYIRPSICFGSRSTIQAFIDILVADPTVDSIYAGFADGRFQQVSRGISNTTDTTSSFVPAGMVVTEVANTATFDRQVFYLGDFLRATLESEGAVRAGGSPALRPQHQCLGGDQFSPPADQARWAAGVSPPPLRATYAATFNASSRPWYEQQAQVVASASSPAEDKALFTTPYQFTPVVFRPPNDGSMPSDLRRIGVSMSFPVREAGDASVADSSAGEILAVLGIDIRAAQALDAVLQSVQEQLFAKSGVRVHTRLVEPGGLGIIATSDTQDITGPAVDTSMVNADDLAASAEDSLDKFDTYPRVDVSGGNGLIATTSRANLLSGLEGVSLVDEEGSPARRVGEQELLSTWEDGDFVHLVVLPHLPVLRGTVLVMSVNSNEVASNSANVELYAVLGIITVGVSIFMLLGILVLATWRLSRLMSNTVLGGGLADDDGTHPPTTPVSGQKQLSIDAQAAVIDPNVDIADLSPTSRRLRLRYMQSYRTSVASSHASGKRRPASGRAVPERILSPDGTGGTRKLDGSVEQSPSSSSRSNASRAIVNRRKPGHAWASSGGGSVKQSGHHDMSEGPGWLAKSMQGGDSDDDDLETYGNKQGRKHNRGKGKASARGTTSARASAGLRRTAPRKGSITNSEGRPPFKARPIPQASQDTSLVASGEIPGVPLPGAVDRSASATDGVQLSGSINRSRGLSAVSAMQTPSGAAGTSQEALVDVHGRPGDAKSGSADRRTSGDRSDAASLRIEGVQRVEHADDLSSDTGADDDDMRHNLIPDYASEMLDNGISPMQATLQLLTRIRKNFPIDGKTRRYVLNLEQYIRIGGQNLFMPQGAETMLKGLADGTEKSARRAERKRIALLGQSTYSMNAGLSSATLGSAQGRHRNLRKNFSSMYATRGQTLGAQAMVNTGRDEMSGGMQVSGAGGPLESMEMGPGTQLVSGSHRDDSMRYMVLRSRASAPNMVASVVAGHLVPAQVREATIRERSKRRARQRLRKASSKLMSIRNISRPGKSRSHASGSKRSIATAVSIREPLADGVLGTNSKEASGGRQSNDIVRAGTPNTTDLAVVFPDRQVSDDGTATQLALHSVSAQGLLHKFGASIDGVGFRIPRKRDVTFVKQLPEPFYELPLPHLYAYAKHLQCAAELRSMGRQDDVVAQLDSDAQTGRSASAEAPVSAMVASMNLAPGGGSVSETIRSGAVSGPAPASGAMGIGNSSNAVPPGLTDTIGQSGGGEHSVSLGRAEKKDRTVSAGTGSDAKGDSVADGVPSSARSKATDDAPGSARSKSSKSSSGRRKSRRRSIESMAYLVPLPDVGGKNASEEDRAAYMQAMAKADAVEQEEQRRSSIDAGARMESRAVSSSSWQHRRSNASDVLVEPELRDADEIPVHLTRGLYVERPLHLRFLPGMRSLDRTLGTLTGEEDIEVVAATSQGLETDRKDPMVGGVAGTPVHEGVGRARLTSPSGEYMPEDHLRVILSRLPARSAEVELRKDITRGFKQWDWDIRKIAEIGGYCMTHHMPLVVDCAVEYLGVTSSMADLSRASLARYMGLVEATYRPQSFCSYHSAVHGSDVTHSMVFLLGAYKLQVLSDVERLAAVIAPAVHDVAHPMVSSVLLENTSSPLALRYPGSSLLESYHVATAMEIMHSMGMDNPLAGLHVDDNRHCRHLIVQIVLATDMSRSVEFNNQFRFKVLQADQEANSAFYAKYGHDGRKLLRQRRAQGTLAAQGSSSRRFGAVEPMVTQPAPSSGSGSDPAGGTPYQSDAAGPQADQKGVRFTLNDYDNSHGDSRGEGTSGSRSSYGSIDTTLSGDESDMEGLVKPQPIPDVLMALRMVIKCADIGHAAKPFAYHVEWSRRVVTEFYRQGIEEHARGLPVQQFMDVANMPAIAGSQCGFLQFVAQPIFEGFSQYAPEASVLVERLLQNKEEWTKLKETSSGEDLALAEPGCRVLPFAPDGSLPTGGYVCPDGRGLESMRLLPGSAVMPSAAGSSDEGRHSGQSQSHSVVSSHRAEAIGASLELAMCAATGFSGSSRQSIALPSGAVIPYTNLIAQPPQFLNRIGGQDGDDAEVRVKALFDFWRQYHVYEQVAEEANDGAVAMGGGAGGQ